MFRVLVLGSPSSGRWGTPAQILVNNPYQPHRSPNRIYFRINYATNSLILTFTMGKSVKRRRKAATSDAVADGEKCATSLLTSLPFELIAEILLYSTSPADILSLSRTCKHFCATLVQNPVATFIWKHVRAQTKPPVPDPTKLGLSEPQLANFIYGGGKCVVRAPLPSHSSHTQLSRSRCVAKSRTICMRRFLPGYDSVETRSVVRSISQSARSPPGLPDLQSPTERNARFFTTLFLRTRSGYPGSNGRTPLNVGRPYHSSKSSANSIQRRSNNMLSSRMVGYRCSGWWPASVTIVVTYYRLRTSTIKPHFPR